MSESPPYERDTASSSPESPKEEDFSSQLLCDNRNSLEEHEAHEDQKDPIIIIQDNCSGSPLNAHVSGSVFPCSLVSTEFMEVRGLDGRFITLVSTQTQTDWEWVEQSLSFSCEVQKEIEDPQLLQAAVESVDTDSSQVQSHRTTPLLFSDIKLGEESEDESMPEKEHDIPRAGPPRLIAYKPEPKQTRVGKVPEVESKQYVHLVQCDYCQQLCQPFVRSERLENETDFERLFCCEQAKQMITLILEERDKMAQKESDRKIDVNSHAPIMSEGERETAKEKAKKRLRRLKKKKPKPKQAEQVNLNIDLGRIEIKHKTFRLPKEVPNDEPAILQINIKTTTGLFTLQEETDGEPKECLKLKEVMKKFYKSGKCFCTSYPDGAGNVFYPSGNAAIIISSAEAADFTYIILEDKDVAPNIKGIFTNKGHSTCYHPNGMIWLNLTPAGGLCLSETGALRRRWNWLYFDPHVRNLPFKPLTFALGPNISVRIHSQEHVYVTFAHRQNSVRFSVGSKLKLMYPERHDKPGQDVLERYIQMKSSEIYSLLGQMQTCMSLHYSFITQTQQLSRQMEKEKSPKEIKTHVN